MAPGDLQESSMNYIVDGMGSLGIEQGSSSHDVVSGESSVQVTCFTETSDGDVTLHFQIIKLGKQIYAWIGGDSAKFGHLYAAASTRHNSNTVSVANILGGVSDNTGSGIARRIVLKTGVNVILACNIPKNSPMLEADAEKRLLQKLVGLGYAKPISGKLSSS